MTDRNRTYQNGRLSTHSDVQCGSANRQTSFSGRGNAKIKLPFSGHIANKLRRHTILQLNIEGLTASKMSFTNKIRFFIDYGRLIANSKLDTFSLLFYIMKYNHILHIYLPNIYLFTVLSKPYLSWGKTGQIAHVCSPFSGIAQKTIFAHHTAEATRELGMECWC